ncbi:FadR/GntR family transcriptional regulator [Actinomycetospora sp. TBRC 11914]|uniref:FadR/GntR family transcriptional regulator n=1 Tax=Actinomycetospora sp. TBRC 11914 TaxID=2729387 RepID=UPI00145F6228|nr:FCD domain-containing protein [Actinomycetospora sp. TBRC 11914]NMO89154.1 FadR family transcriptional regulator [Actinomycetospora sp. TBRC 11914]
MPLQSPRRGSVIGDVIAQMETMVVSGEWPVGTRIPPEPELVAALGVGRNSVREAVRALAHTGMLEVRQGDGTWVRAASGLGTVLDRYVRRADARHVLEVRRGLEREAARLAARRRTDDDLERLTAALARQHELAAADDPAGFVRGDLEFHRLVAAAAHNPVLTDLLDHLGEALTDTIAVTVDAQRAVGSPRFHVHTDLLDAVRAGDADAAGRASDALLDELLALLGDPA